jgi:hypothetical protein
MRATLCFDWQNFAGGQLGTRPRLVGVPAIRQGHAHAVPHERFRFAEQADIQFRYMQGFFYAGKTNGRPLFSGKPLQHINS